MRFECGYDDGGLKRRRDQGDGDGANEGETRRPDSIGAARRRIAF
jgi:hypothetical protein